MKHCKNITKITVTSGAKINGMIKVGFITIGTPNILTSPILNNSGTKAIRAIDLFLDVYKLLT